MATVAVAQVKLTLVDNVTAGIKRIQAAFTRLSQRIGLDRIARSARSLGRGIRAVGKGFKRTTSRLGVSPPQSISAAAGCLPSPLRW